MNLTTWIDVAIGLTIIYLGVSLFVTIINEYIAQMLNLRGKQLQTALKQLIDNETIRQALMQSPALESFFKDQPQKAESYVDPQILGRFLVGSLSAAGAADDTVRQFSESVNRLSNSALKVQLQVIVRTTENTTGSLVAAVSDWLDRSLTMLGESYKRDLQKISLGVGFAVAVILNINTITLTEHLYRDKDARDAAITLAIQITEQTSKESLEKCNSLPVGERKNDTACAQFDGLMDAVQKRNDSLGKLPIGWSQIALPQSDAVIKKIYWGVELLLGWLLTALAVSLGAPFWFDLLNKVISVRHGMRKPEAAQTDKKT